MASTKDPKVPKEFASRALAKVKEKLASDKLPCQLCGVDLWNIEEMPSFLVMWDVGENKNPIFSGSKISGLPLVALTCKNCGNTLLVNAMVLGLGDLIPSDQQMHD